MNLSTTPDPVNRWATEHYGFDDEPTSPTQASSIAGPRQRAQKPSTHPRRRSAWLAGGVLSVLLGAVGFGGITMAANAADAGRGDGGRDAAVTSSQVDRSDDGGGVRGGPDDGGVGGFDGSSR